MFSPLNAEAKIDALASRGYQPPWRWLCKMKGICLPSFQFFVLFQCWDIYDNENLFLYFVKIIHDVKSSHGGGAADYFLDPNHLNFKECQNSFFCIPVSLWLNNGLANCFSLNRQKVWHKAVIIFFSGTHTIYPQHILTVLSWFFCFLGFLSFNQGVTFIHILQGFHIGIRSFVWQPRCPWRSLVMTKMNDTEQQSSTMK